MSKGKDSGLAPPAGDLSASNRWVTGAFLPFLAGLSAAAAFILVRDGKGWVLLVTMVAGVLLWSLERLEIRYIAASTRGWNPLPGVLAPVVVISLAIFIVYFPTLNIYFWGDDFGYVHFFHTPSLSQFLRLFHTDIGRVVWGESRQELRPFFNLYYMVSYQLWGVNPVGYHLSGILLHLLNSLMVFLIAKELAPGKSWRAGFAGLLFAVLPIHSSTLSMILYVVADVFPTFLYLAAFLCFMRFRATGLVKYLVLSTFAFAGCLLSKEIAVTLPVMVVSYDLFRKLWGENGAPAGASFVRKRLWRGRILSYLPFAVLLLAYLALRYILFASVLQEDTWARSWSAYVQEGVSGPAGFLQRLAYLGRYLQTLQAFTLRQLLLPFPAAVLGLVLGLYMVWVFSLLRRRSECHQSITTILYFGLVWYLISGLPLLVTSLGPRHLYLPAVGPCIAAAFLALPALREPRKEVGCLRLLGAVFLVCFSASLVWKENIQWGRVGEMSRRMTVQLVAALEDTSKQALVITSLEEDFILPYALQTPFAPTDLYSRARIIELPYTYCCPISQWWEKTRLVLGTELAGAPDEPMEIHLLAWDKRTNSLQRRKRVLPRRLLGTCVTKVLAGPLEAVNSIHRDTAEKLVQALARLVAERR